MALSGVSVIHSPPHCSTPAIPVYATMQTAVLIYHLI